MSSTMDSCFLLLKKRAEKLGNENEEKGRGLVGRPKDINIKFLFGSVWDFLAIADKNRTCGKKQLLISCNVIFVFFIFWPLRFRICLQVVELL